MSTCSNNTEISMELFIRKDKASQLVRATFAKKSCQDKTCHLV